jgi:tetratricopeptide (TPR) repeat protein
VGYQAALRLRGPLAPGTDTATKSGVDQSTGVHTGAAADTNVVALDFQNGGSQEGGARALNFRTNRQLLRSAVERGHSEEVIEYGKLLNDAGNAEPTDLLAVAQSYAARKDCPNALAWVYLANDAFHASGKEASGALSEIKTRCESDIRPKPVPLTDAERERMLRLLTRLKARAEADRDNLPAFEAQAAASNVGQLDVKLGELYFGFGEYKQAIVVIQRGLGKGQVKSLDEAYVYLGESQVALGNLAEARKSFAQLNDVPNISPRVLRLWQLYADTLR